MQKRSLDRDTAPRQPRAHHYDVGKAGGNAQIGDPGRNNGFGAADIVKSVAIAAGTGEVVVFTAPLGCGTSPLRCMVTGIEAVSTGEIVIAGARVPRGVGRTVPWPAVDWAGPAL